MPYNNYRARYPRRVGRPNRLVTAVPFKGSKRWAFNRLQSNYAFRRRVIARARSKAFRRRIIAYKRSTARRVFFKKRYYKRRR